MEGREEGGGKREKVSFSLSATFFLKHKRGEEGDAGRCTAKREEKTREGGEDKVKNIMSDFRHKGINPNRAIALGFKQVVPAGLEND